MFRAPRSTLPGCHQQDDLVSRPSCRLLTGRTLDFVPRALFAGMLRTGCLVHEDLVHEDLVHEDLFQRQNDYNKIVA